MTMRAPETHEARFVDLPLVRRLIEDGVVVDTELICTRDTGGTASLILSRLLPQRGVYTLVGRAGEQRAVGQFKMRADSHLAQMVFVAPAPKRRCARPGAAAPARRDDRRSRTARGVSGDGGGR